MNFGVIIGIGVVCIIIGSFFTEDAHELPFDFGDGLMLVVALLTVIAIVQQIMGWGCFAMGAGN